jgi:hypothetical protein
MFDLNMLGIVTVVSALLLGMALSWECWMRKASSSSQTASKEVSFTLIGAIMSFEENT